MRPVPRSRHLLAVLILAAASAVSGYFVSLDDRLSTAQANIASAAVKRHDPQRYTHDPIFGDELLWRFHTPAVQGILELFLVPTDYQDLRLPFRAMAGVMTMVFLCGMYALLWAQCRSWSVAVFTAILSTRVIEALGGSYWGIGSMASIAPPGICQALLPLVVLAFLRYSRPAGGDLLATQWRVLLVFGFVGLLGNFHLVTAMNATIILLVAYVARQRFRPRCLPVAIGCALAALVAALPYAWYYVGLRAAASGPAGEADPAVVYEAFRIGQLVTLYPELLTELLDWRLLAGGLVLVTPAVTLVLRIDRFRTQNLRVWVWMVLGGVLTAFVLHGVSQAAGKLLNVPPPVTDFVQAAGLVMLPLYVMLAQSIVNLFRLLHGHRRLLRWAGAVLLAAWMVPADNLRVPRYAVVDLATRFMDEADKPSSVIRHHDKAARRAELAAIGQWALGRAGSVYLTDRGEFRALARRPIVLAPSDARYLHHLAPGRLGDWMKLFRRQQALLHPPAGRADGKAIAQFVTELVEADPKKLDLAEWYVILPAGAAPERPAPLKPVEGGRWGRHYCLFRIR